MYTKRHEHRNGALSFFRTTQHLKIKLALIQSFRSFLSLRKLYKAVEPLHCWVCQSNHGFVEEKIDGRHSSGTSTSAETKAERKRLAASLRQQRRRTRFLLTRRVVSGRLCSSSSSSFLFGFGGGERVPFHFRPFPVRIHQLPWKRRVRHGKLYAENFESFTCRFVLICVL